MDQEGNDSRRGETKREDGNPSGVLPIPTSKDPVGGHEGAVTETVNMTVLVAGGRYLIPTESAIANVAKELKKLKAEAVMHGGAQGGDRIGELAAKKVGVPCVVYRPDWERYGQAAGPLRNQIMVSKDPFHAILLPGGKGTNDVRWRLGKAKIPITFIDMVGVYSDSNINTKKKVTRIKRVDKG